MLIKLYLLLFLLLPYSTFAEILNYKKLEPVVSKPEETLPAKTTLPLVDTKKEEPKIIETKPQQNFNTPIQRVYNFARPYSDKVLTLTKFSDNPEEPHRGVVLSPIDSGTVISSLEGKVVAVDYMDGYNNYVIIEHPNGFYSVYGNMDLILVGEGQFVKKGETLGSLLKEKGLYFQISQGKKYIDPNLLIKS
jgi:murein DD-endopeptidase MepM/ murein hydrolase activator NlpD